MATRTRIGTPRPSRWLGELEGMDGGLLYGWCVDTQQPDARVVLEVCLNGEAMETVTADVVRTDLAGRFGALATEAGPAKDCCHGFVADLYLEQRHLHGTLTVRVANASVELPGCVVDGGGKSPPVTALTAVFGDGGLRVQGWARNPEPNRPSPVVRAFIGNREVASAVADVIHHPALRHFGIEANGFILDLPPELADGRVHTVRVVDSRGVPLNGSPLTICCHKAGARTLLTGDASALLATVMDSYERFLPRSVGFAHSANWAREFEQSGPVPASKLKAGIVLTPGSAEQLKRTESSLASQQGAGLEVFTLPEAATRSPNAFRSFMDKVFASGCDAIGFVRAGDALVPHALAYALQGFAGQTQVVYTDSEFQGRPWFKPAWNLNYALATDFPLDLMLVRAKWAQTCLKEDPSVANDASLSWLALIAASRLGPAGIVHVPRVLHVWGSPVGEQESKQREAAAQAALRYIDRDTRLEKAAAQSPDSAFIARRPVRTPTGSERKERVTLLIPTRDRVDLLERCLESIRKHTHWPSLEIIVIDNDSAEPDTKAFFRKVQRQGVKILSNPGAFNFARMNNDAVAAASGSIVGLINNDIEALHDGWLDEIVGQLLRPGVEIVGAKLLWPNGMVQHGGVVLGVGNAAAHFGNRLADGDWGDHGRNQLVHEVSAVTAACLFIRTKDYQAAGGMDETAFPVNFNDVDLCLKVRRRGGTVVWTPHARLLHAESASRGPEESPAKRARTQRELDMLRQRWGHVLLRDPAYHPSLNLDAHSHAFGGLALPPRDRSPRPAGLPI